MDIVKFRNELLKQNFLKYLPLGIFFCLVAIGCFALEILVSGLGIILVILLLIPLYLGTILYAYSLKNSNELIMKNYLRCSFSYYNKRFFGCFRLIRVFLKTMLVELIASTVMLIILYFVFKSNYGNEFVEVIEKFIDMTMSQTVYSVEETQALFTMNNGLLDKYLTISESIASIFGAFTFIYGISYNTIPTYFRGLVAPEALFMAKPISLSSVEKSRKEIVNDYWKLNWPIMLVIAISLIVGCLISICALEEYGLCMVYGLMLTFIVLIPLYPLYISNMDSIFTKYQTNILGGIKLTVHTAMSQIEKSKKLTKEEIEEIRSNLKVFDEEPKPDDENKKDPDSGS